MSNLRPRAILLFMIVGALLLTGCAPYSLYSAERDKQGQESTKAAEMLALALKTQVAAPRTNNSAILTEQLAMEDLIWVEHREAASASISTWTIGKFQEEIDLRLKFIAGTSDLEAIETAINASREANDRMPQHIATLDLSGLAPPNCKELLTEDGLSAAIKDATVRSAMARQVASVVLPQAKKDCALLGLNALPKGELSLAIDSYLIDEQAIETAEFEAKVLKSTYNVEKAKYTVAVSTLLENPDDSDSRGRIDAAIGKVIGLVQSAKSVRDAFSIRVLTEERLTALDNFFVTYEMVVKGEKVEDGNRAAIALAVFPDLRNRARRSLRDEKKPTLVPLAIQKTIELEKLEGLKREIGLRQQIVAERKSHAISLGAQIASLVEARQALQDEAIRAAAALPMRDLMTRAAKTDPELEAKIKLWRAAMRFLDAGSRLRAESGKSYYRISALEHERVLMRVETNIQQWRALIEPSMALMADYGASGLRSSDISGFFNSAMLAIIAMGTL